MPHSGLAVPIITTSQNISHEKSDFTKIAPHRRFFNSPMICRLPGHGKLETTARYAHLARDSAQEAAERVAASIAEDMLQGAGRNCQQTRSMMDAVFL
ncbi:MAG: hypothetical protein OXE44_07560 [Nitrospinae bacterium]|nr:hypothetical protein [Nitrospinota bacterium]